MLTQNGIRILAVDDHPIFLQGIAECFKALPVTASVDICTNYADLRRRLEVSVPDIIFLDLNLGTHDGFTICREIKNEFKNIFIAVLTQYDSDKFVAKAREHGAGAYFIKNTDPEVLARFLKEFAEGKINHFFSYTSLSNAESKDLFPSDGFELVEQLSKREKQVMRLLIKGCTRDEIQAELKISYDTVKSHRYNILQKLHLNSVSDLIIFAVKNKLAEAAY